MNKAGRAPAVCLALCLVLSLAACGGKGKAASMWLVRTEGHVEVSDENGGNVDLAERLGLYSGYEVRTRSESYGWIDLDEVKLTKLDQDSGVEVRKDDKVLELGVLVGAALLLVLVMYLITGWIMERKLSV